MTGYEALKFMFENKDVVVTSAERKFRWNSAGRGYEILDAKHGWIGTEESIAEFFGAATFEAQVDSAEQKVAALSLGEKEAAVLKLIADVRSGKAR